MADDYQVLEELGSGSFGVVYKAIEKSTGEMVAVKHIDLEGGDDDILEIQQEISLLAACSSPWVTKYKTSFVKGVKLWIVMEYMGGGSCLDLLGPGSFLEAHIAIVCRELLRGLDYLHATGKIHRDIKAANVLLTNSGRVKLADFGVAAQLTNIKSQRNTFVGTPFWMAPEVIQEVGYDFRADIWSLGITALELANAEPPHANIHPMKVLFLIPKAAAPRLEGGNWSRDFRDFISQCLIKDPDRRPTAKELLRHKFVQRAGKVEGLRELIERKQLWEASQQKRNLPKYYEETLRDMSSANDSEDWVFDTVKKATIAPPTARTQAKRRKVSSRSAVVEVAEESTETLMERLSLADGPLGTGSPVATPNSKVRNPPARRTPTVRTRRRSSFATAVRMPSTGSPGTARRVSGRKAPAPIAAESDVTESFSFSTSNSKQPLAIDLSFGNGTSTARQFRRVSAEQDDEQQQLQQSAVAAPAAGGLRRQQPHTPSRPSNRLSMISVTDENTPPPPSLATAKYPSDAHDAAQSQADTTSIVRRASTKDSLLGHRLFSKAIDPALQETLAQTSGSKARDALAQVATAMSDLDQLDPGGAWALMKGILERLGNDKIVAGGLGITTTGASPQKGAKAVGGKKLVLATDNPHLKSHHRRRQSAIVLGSNQSSSSLLAGDDSSMMSQGPTTASSRAGGGGGGNGLARSNSNRIDPGRLPGYTPEGMEHVSQLRDALYGRWVEGLSRKWGNAVVGGN